MIASSAAKLVFTNPSTNDVFEYDLVGNVTEPLAQEHIIMKCVQHIIKDRPLANKETNCAFK
jgi:hypothetical protein